MGEFVQFKYKYRAYDNAYERGISEMYEHGNFDTTLISSEGLPVPAHRFVLGMFSDYFHIGLADLNYTNDVRVVVNLRLSMVQQLVELFYQGSVYVGKDEAEEFNKALIQLKVSGVDCCENIHEDEENEEDETYEGTDDDDDDVIELKPKVDIVTIDDSSNDGCIQSSDEEELSDEGEEDIEDKEDVSDLEADEEAEDVAEDKAEDDVENEVDDEVEDEQLVQQNFSVLSIADACQPAE